MAVAGFKLRNAFNHFVFIDVLDVDNFRSVRGGDPKSALPKNNSLCQTNKRKKERIKNEHGIWIERHEQKAIL